MTNILHLLRVIKNQFLPNLKKNHAKIETNQCQKSEYLYSNCTPQFLSKTNQLQISIRCQTNAKQKQLKPHVTIFRVFPLHQPCLSSETTIRSNSLTNVSRFTSDLRLEGLNSAKRIYVHVSKSHERVVPHKRNMRLC